MIGSINFSTDFETIAVFVMVAAFTGGLTWLIKKVNTLAHNSKNIHEAFIGRPATPGDPGLPSYGQRFQTISDNFVSVGERFDDIDKKFVAVGARFDSQDLTLQDLEHEVTTNNGTSVKDCVIRVETALAEHTEHEEKAMERLETKLDKHMDDTAKEVTAATKTRTARTRATDKKPAAPRNTVTRKTTSRKVTPRKKA